MKGKKIFKKIMVSVLVLAIMCSNIPASAGSLPEDGIETITDGTPESAAPQNEAPGSVEEAGSEEPVSSAQAPPVTDNLNANQEVSSDDSLEQDPPAQTDPSAGDLLTQPSETPVNPSAEDPSAQLPETPADPSTEDSPAAPGETPADPSEGDSTLPSADAPADAAVNDSATQPSEPSEEEKPEGEMPAEEQPEETVTEEDTEYEEDPMDFEDQVSIEDASILPDAEGTVATIWMARAPRAMLFSLYNLESDEDGNKEKAWTFDAYYVNQTDPYNVTKTENFDLKYQMEFHANQDLVKGAVLIRMDAALYTDRNGNVVLPTEIAVPEGTLENPVPNRTTPFNYFKDTDENGKTWLVFFNYKKIPSGSNAAWQVLYRNQKLMNIIDETPWELTPMIRVDTEAKKPEDAGEYNPETFENGAEKRTALTGKVDSSVSLTSVSKIPYREPGRNYGPGLYTKTQIEKYINGTVPSRYLENGRLDTAKWRFAVWEVTVKGTASQPWMLSALDTPSVSGDRTGMEVVGYKDHSDSTTAYRLPVNAPAVSYYTGSFEETDFYNQNQTEESWGNRFYVVTAYPADKVAVGTTLENQIQITLTPCDTPEDKVVKIAEPSTWIYADYDWDYKGEKIGIQKKNGIGSGKDEAEYTGWLSAYERASGKGQDYGDIPYSTTSVMHGYSDTHWTESGEENGTGYTTGDYKPGTWYTFTAADDLLYLHYNDADGKEQERKLMTGDDYYFSEVTITQTDRGYDVWEDELKQESELYSVDQSQLPEGIFNKNGSLASEVRVYAMLANSDNRHEKDAAGWELVQTEYMDAYSGQTAFSLDPGIIAQEPYRIKVEHDSIDFESTCQINVRVRLKALSKDETVRAGQLMSKVVAAHENIGTDVASPYVRLENLSSAFCRAYQKSENEQRQTAIYCYGAEDIDKNYGSQGEELKTKTEEFYPGVWTEEEPRLPIRDNAVRTLTWLNEVAQANKASKSTNDVNNNRVLVDYYLTAYDGYKIYDRNVLNYLNEEEQNELLSPGRTHVVFYDLLPYGMQYDASVEPVAGRITELDTNGYYKNRPGNWNKTQVSVKVDPDRDITPDYRGTGRTMVAFHIIFDGADAASYTAQKWIEGWGVTFRAYYDWKDINQINYVDVNSNLCAFMPDFGSEEAIESNKDHPDLCGLKTEVDYDDGTHGDAESNRGSVEKAYEDMVRAYVKDGKTIRGNIDGVSSIQTENGEVEIDKEYRNVLYAKNSLSDNVATASSSRIETLVHADADRLGAFGPTATVPVSDNPPAGSLLNLYTYDNTVTVDTDTTNIVIFNQLENAYNVRGKEDPFHPFDGENEKWSGTFRGIDTSGLEKQLAEQLENENVRLTVYYSMAENAEFSTGNNDPHTILNAEKGWYTEEQLINEKGSEWQKCVRAVAVDLGNAVIKANSSVSFRIKMEAPGLSSLPENSSVYTYNNASFYSESTNGSAESKHTVAGNSVRVGLSPMQTLEVIKRTSGEVPTALLDERFEFHVYEEYMYEGETTEKALAYAEYKLYKQNKEGGWDEQTDKPHATDGNGYFYLHADEKAVFQAAGAVSLKVDETENVFWEQKVSDQILKNADGRLIGAGDGDLRRLTVTNVYRPVLYVQKSLSSVPAGTVLTEADQTFTFRIRTMGSDGKYYPVANAEYWKVDSVRLDGAIPARLDGNTTLKTDENGEFTIRKGEIIALFPGVAGTQYELSEVIPADGNWNWHCENSVLTGKLPSGGASRTITNYYRWKDLRLKKEITHQTQDDYNQMEQKSFTFRLFEAELNEKGEPVTDADGNPVAKKLPNSNIYTTSGLEWVLLDQDGNESSVEGESGTLSPEGTFACALGFRTVVFRKLDAGKLYVLEELSDGIPTEDGTPGGRKLYVPNNDTMEVKMPVYSTGKDVTFINDFQKRPLSVTKTVVGGNADSGNTEDGNESTEMEAYGLDHGGENNSSSGSGTGSTEPADGADSGSGNGTGDGTAAGTEYYKFKVTITRPQADGTSKPVPVNGVGYTVTKQGAVTRTGTLDENGEFTLSDGETVTFKDIGMLGDMFEVAEQDPDNANQIYPAKGTNHTGTLAGDGCEVSFVNGEPGTLLISKEYTAKNGDAAAGALVEEWKAWTLDNSYPLSCYPRVAFVLKVWVDGEPYTDDVWVTEINQLNGKTTEAEAYFITPGEPFMVDPWVTISVSTVSGKGLPPGAVYTLEEMEEDRIEKYLTGEEDSEDSMSEKINWMQISQTEASKTLKTEKSVEARPVAVVINEVSTLDPFTGSECVKRMTPASSEVPEGAELVWRVEQYDPASGQWNPAERVSYAVFDGMGEPVSPKIEYTENGLISLVKTMDGYPTVRFQTEKVYLNLYKAEDIANLLGKVPEGGRLLRIVEVPEDSDREWGLLAGYIGPPQANQEILPNRPLGKASRMQIQHNMNSFYSMSMPPEDAAGFMNSNAKEAVEIEKQMSEAAETGFTMILKQVLSFKTAEGGGVPADTILTESDITADRPGAGIPYTLCKADGTRVSKVTGPNGEIELQAGERAALDLPEGTRWTVHEQTFSTPNYRLTDLSDNGNESGRLAKLNENLMLINLPVSKQYTLRFEDNRGSGGPGVLTQLKKSTETGPVTFTIPGIEPTREGYTFQGWTETPGTDQTEQTVYKAGNSFTLPDGKAGAVLYAKWKEDPCFTVNYTDGVEGKIVFADQGYEKLHEGDATPKFVGTPTREGYSFMGWSPDVNPVVSADDDADNDGVITYTATWKREYTVKYMAAVSTWRGSPVDWSGSPSEIWGGAEHGKLYQGDNTPQPDTDNASGYTFLGCPEWKEKIDAADADNEGVITYYPRFVKVVDQRYFTDGNKDGGSNGGINIIKEDKTIKIPLTASYTKNGGEPNYYNDVKVNICGKVYELSEIGGTVDWSEDGNSDSYCTISILELNNEIGSRNLTGAIEIILMYYRTASAE